MAKRKEEPNRDGTLAVLHQLSRDIVYGGDVIRIDSVAKPESVGEDSGAQEHRIVVQRKKRPYPGKQIPPTSNAYRMTSLLRIGVGLRIMGDNQTTMRPQC